MKCIRFVARTKHQSLRIWACQGLIEVEEGRDHEDEGPVDVMELEWLFKGE